MRIKHMLLKNLPQKILALLLAIGVWFYVGLQNPNSTLSFKNIPLRYSSSGVDTNEAGLTVISNKNILVEVVATGKRNVLTSFSSSEIRAYVDVSDITEPGTYTRQVLISMPVGGITVDKISPITVNLKLDKIVSKSVPVVLVIEGENKYTTREIMPKEVTITGPASDLENIVEAKAIVAGDEAKQTVSFELSSRASEVPDTSHISTDVQKITVTASGPVSEIPVVPPAQ